MEGRIYRLITAETMGCMMIEEMQDDRGDAMGGRYVRMRDS